MKNLKTLKNDMSEYVATFFYHNKYSETVMPLDIVTICAKDSEDAQEMASEIAVDEMQPFCLKHDMQLAKFILVEAM